MKKILQITLFTLIIMPLFFGITLLLYKGNNQ